jgi:hypothetical protein
MRGCRAAAPHALSSALFTTGSYHGDDNSVVAGK